MFFVSSRRRTKRQIKWGLWVYPFVLIGTALLWIGGSSPTAAQTALHDNEAQAKIEAAWADVAQMVSYEFRTLVDQTAYPKPSIANAGRPPMEETMGLEGSFTLDTGRMETTIWPDATFDPDRGADMLIENGKSYIRQSATSAWEEVGDVGGTFAPGGDPFSFLAGMKNVQAIGLETRTIAGVTLQFETFAFDLNSGAFAAYVERRNAQIIAEQGELPAGLEPGVDEQLREMTGNGQVWLDQNGNIARLTLDLNTPATDDAGPIVATITSDFYSYVYADTAMTSSLMSAPFQTVVETAAVVAQPENASKLGWAILAVGLLILVALFVWRTVHTKVFHTTLASVIICGMVLPPLIQAGEVRAYYEEQVAESQEQAAEQEKHETQQTARESYFANDWNPHINPQELGQRIQDAYQSGLVPDAVPIATVSAADDGDGVDEETEALWDSCPYQVGTSEYSAEEDCDGVTDPSDSDGDGLSDEVEIEELGTLPDDDDTDGDHISDLLEVTGFTYNEQVWYLDPLEADSNNDGRSDALECFVWNAENEDFDENGICPDTDGDGSPDLFDTDNDNDEVLDIDDIDPDTAGEVVYDQDNPLALTLNGLEIDKPVVVEIQFRPTDENQLTYSGLVLDWPEGDYEGQITRGLTTTFATTTNEDAASTDAFASYGDVRITPMIEVTAPYTDGHYANLPVNDTYTGIDRTLGITIGQWLDETELESYSVSVSDVDETSGDLIMYLPLSTAYSESGDHATAFGTKLYYQPTQGTNGVVDWGMAHQVRLIWMVQMLTDSCVADVDEDGDGDTENEEGADCTREESFSTIHTYWDESWLLTGLTVTEEHGVDIAQLYENPAEDEAYGTEDQLWLYAWNIGNTFAAGLDCDTADGDGNCVGDGERDVTLANLSSYLDVWGTDEDDGINYNYVDMTGPNSYLYWDYLAYEAITVTGGILDSEFTPYVDDLTYATVLIAYENTNRSLSLGNAADGGDGAWTFDFSEEVTSMMAGYMLKTYAYNEDSAVWEEADQETYLEYLVDYLQENDDYFALADDSDEAADEVEGELLWFQNYYVMLATGTAGTVESDGLVIDNEEFDSESDAQTFSDAAQAVYSASETSGAGRVNSAAFRILADFIKVKALNPLFKKRNFKATFGSYMKFMYSVDIFDQVEKVRAGGTNKTLPTKTFQLYDSKKLTNILKDSKLKAMKNSMRLFLVGAAVALISLAINEASSTAGTVVATIGLVMIGIASVALVLQETLALIGKIKLIKLISGVFHDAKKLSGIKTKLVSHHRSHAGYGLLAGVFAALISFGASMYALGHSPKGFQVLAVVAYLIATIIVEIIFAIIGLFVPAGTFATLFIEFIDTLLLILNFIWDEVPSGVSNAVSEWLAGVLYHFDMHANNLDEDDRLLTDFEMNLADSSLGYVSSNTMLMTMTVTNTLDGGWAQTETQNIFGFTYTTTTDIARNAFDYDLSEDETALDHVTLNDGDNIDEWVNLAGSTVVTDVATYLANHPDAISLDRRIRLTRTLTHEIPLTDFGLGKNVTSPDTYFIERSHLTGEGCWLGAIDCKVYDFNNTATSQFDAIVLDVLPNTLSQFVDFGWIDGFTTADESADQTAETFSRTARYSTNRSQTAVTSASVTTEVEQDDSLQYDNDGDGLINTLYNGTDPDDTTDDADGDGLSDYYEITYGYDAEAADGDGDGLNDWEEIMQYYTDPTLADSDNDGLNDYMEVVQGWLVLYEDVSGDESITRVWSDPWDDDLDEDGIGDLQEFLYGFHPEIANDASDIDNLIEIEDISLEETAGPQLLLQFEDETGDTVVSDSSGYDNNFGCEMACPTFEADGYYGQAFSFDGVDDQITATLDFESAEFSTAVWIYPEAGSNAGNYYFVMGDPDTSSTKAATLLLGNETDLWASFSNSNGSATYALQANGFVTSDSWNHIATTYDGTTYTIYVNGTVVNSSNNMAGATPYAFEEYDVGYRGHSNAFTGLIDELLVYDYALTEAEIGEVMDGRYNTNDLIVHPGAELNYSAIVTNTSATRNANGFLSADTSVSSPEIPEPIHAFGFEVEQRLAYFPSQIQVKSSAIITNGGTMYCIDDGTCPIAGGTGAFGTSIAFDGRDDVVYVPKLSSEINEFQEDEDYNNIFFWIYIDQLPTSGETAMILDTDSSRPGATDIYLDSSGYLHLAVDSLNSGVSHQAIPTGQWVHIGYRASPGDGLTINGGDNGDATEIIDDSTDDSHWYLTYGPGRLGNSLDGTAPFHGRIDDLVIYHESISDSELFNRIYTGDYFNSGSGLRADALFEFDELIENDDGTNVGYLDLVTGLRVLDCVVSTIECPSVTTSGKYGAGISFDGVNDALHFDNELNIGRADYTIAFWYKSDTSGYQPIFVAKDDNGSQIVMNIGVTDQIRVLHQAQSDTTEVKTNDSTYDDGVWHYVTAVREDDTLSLYIDGELDRQESGVTAVPTDTFSAALGYFFSTTGSYFNGEMDELVIFDEAIDQDGVNYLMNSTYPAINIDTPFTEFSLDALTTASPSGTATVADVVESGSVHTFEEEVDVMLDFEVDPTVNRYYHHSQDTNDGTDGDSTSFTGYFRFEDEPGSTEFDNLVSYSTANTPDATHTSVEIPLHCLAESCPVAGVQGVDGRALYFDGVDDYLFAYPLGNIVETNDGSYDDLFGSDRPKVESISAWVNGTEGTIFNYGSNGNGYHIQVDMGRVSFIDGFDQYQYAEFDMPINEWVHIVMATVNKGGAGDDDSIRIYVNGEQVASFDTGNESANDFVGNWIVGANYGTQNHFRGYIDDLRMYDVQVGASWAKTLYENTLPYLRFSFDEAADEIIFTDEIRGHIATPVYVECVDLSLESLTVQNLDTNLNNIALDVDSENIYYGSVDDFESAVAQAINISSPICTNNHAITARGIYSDGTEVTFSGSPIVSIAETAATQVAFTSGSQQLDLIYSAAIPYNSTTPVAGTDGRIGNTVYFPGDETGYLTISDSEGLGDFSTDDWTMMTWIRVGEVEDWTPIWSKGDGDEDNDDGEKILLIDNEGQIRFTSRGNGNVSMRSTEPITDSVWHHVALAWNYDDSTGDGTYSIWVDGVDVTDTDHQSDSGTYSDVNPDNATDHWEIGRRGNGSHLYFEGELDEFTVYLGRAFNSTLIYETYLREARWYRDTAEFSVLVDDDNPTLSVQTDYEYLSSGNVILVATPDDATSGISLVQFGVKGPSDSDYTWDTAELCDDSAVVYCPTFFANTEGRYEVIYRLVDSVGNQTITNAYDYYVDLTAPTVTGTETASAEAARVASAASTDTRLTAATSSSAQLSVVVSPTSDISWIATFGGTFDDPDVDSGVDGSGIDEDVFYVTVYNSTGAAVGSLNQVATVNEDNGTWTIDYVMTGLPPAGTYTVKVSVADEKENGAEIIVGTFDTDQQEPDVKMAHQLFPDQIISDTNTLLGVVTDQYEPYGPAFQFHFEEDSSATSFYNYGDNQGLVDCAANCPQTTASGAFGRGLEFDGSARWELDSDVVSETINVIDETFTVSFWLQVDTTQLSSSATLVAKGFDDGSSPVSTFSISVASSDTFLFARRLMIVRSDGTEISFMVSGDSLVDNELYHVVLVREDDLLTLYVNGEVSASVADVAVDTRNDGPLMIGGAALDGDSNLIGMLDELLIYDRALGSDEIYALAQNNVNGNNQVEIALETIDFVSYPDLLTINEDQERVTWSSAVLDNANSLGSAWSYTLSNMEQFAYIHLRGQDGGGNEADAFTGWHGLIDHVPPTVTLAGAQSGYGALGETTYTFTLSDILLDEGSAVYPCDSPELTTLTYDDANLPHDGLAYEISGTCTVDGLESSGTVSICDAAGHCSDETVTPTVSSDLGGIRILTPTVSLTSTLEGGVIEIAGEAVASQEIVSISVTVNDSLIETFRYSGPITETNWSTTGWTPSVTDTYTVTAWLTDTAGNSSRDQIVLTLQEVASTSTLDISEVTADDDSLTFTWSATDLPNGCHVSIYRSATSPYSGFSEWTSVVSSPIEIAVADHEMGYYYLSSPNCGSEVVDSDTVGVFPFVLTLGD